MQFERNSLSFPCLQFNINVALRIVPMLTWLVKSEGDVYSIDQLKVDCSTMWDGVRNYQARNSLKEMKTGDTVFFYHSNSDPTGIAGLAEVSKAAYADPTQFDSKHDHFDPKATKENPRWFCPDLKFVRKFGEVLTLDRLRATKGLEKLAILQKGTRLSVTPITSQEEIILLDLAK